MAKDKRKNETPRSNIFMMILGLIWTLISSISKGIGWAISKSASGAWFLIKQAGNAVGWLLKQPYHLLRYILVGRIPEFENARQEEIFWRIKRQFRRKRLFLLNSIAFVVGIFFSILDIGFSYYNLQQATLPSYQDLYRSIFNNTLFSAGIVMGVWTLILIFHFVFNKMGDAEDIALGDALEKDYARSDTQEGNYRETERVPNIGRLVDATEEDYASDYYDEEKPKRNGARL